jgi:hypothetical protein
MSENLFHVQDIVKNSQKKYELQLVMDEFN